MKNLLVVIYIISVFNVFHLTPISFFADLYIHVFSILGFISFFNSNINKNKILRFTFFTIVTLICSSIISSILFVKQDFLSSVIAIQHIFKGFSIIYIYKLFIDKKIDIYKIFRYLIISIWFFTAILTVASLTKFAFTFLSPISGKQLVITANKYSKDLLYLGEFYFLAKYFHSNRSINLIFLSIIFISTQLYDIQRGDLIFFSATFFISLILFRKKISTQKIYFLLPIFILVGFLFINNSSSSSKINEKFTQLAMVFDEEESGKIDDASIFIRLREIEFALVGFVKHPISGNGIIRSSKQQQLLGDIYFYPADIGMYGVLYTFGIIGFFLFLLFIRRLFYFKFSELNYLSAGLFLFLVYSIFYSIKDGSVIFNPTQYLFCYIIIYLISSKSYRKNKNVQK
jgi:hypothetical protein